jgi:RIO-like serine/threonine protein kinase
VAILEPLAVAHGEDVAGAVLAGRLPIAKALETRAVSAPRPRTSTPRAESNHGALNRGERAILTAIAQHEDGVDREQLSVLTGYKRSSRDTYLQRLHAGGLVEFFADGIRATDTGVDALGTDFTPLPTGEALQAYWLDRLSGGERSILEVLLEAYPNAVTRDEISDQTPYKRSSRDTYLQRLAARKLIATDRGVVRASALLFDGGDSR